MIDQARFIPSMKVARHAKSSLDEAGNPTRWGARPWKPNQVVLEDAEFIYVSRVPVAPGTEIPRLVEIDRGWTLVEEYASRVSGPRGGVGPRGLAKITPWASEDLDRGLQAACDMGRWDIAFMMVVRTWGLGEVTPSSVLWDSFPHMSTMSVVTSGRLFVPGGLSKTVIENWWAWQGGYHCPKPTLYTDWEEYGRVMNGLRNPFRLGGVPDFEPAKVLDTERPVGAIPAAFNPEDLDGRPWWFGDGVAYIANSAGSVLPYWFVTSSKGSQGVVEELAWGPRVRNSLSRQMNLPVLVARLSSAF